MVRSRSDWSESRQSNRFCFRSSEFNFFVWLFGNSFPFADHHFARAIAEIIELREREIQAEPPDALTPAFTEDAHKQRQWNTFLENVALHPGGFANVIAGVAGFIMLHAIAAAKVGSSH